MIGFALYGASAPPGGGLRNPATLALDGYWKAPFTASPWVAAASAGASGSNGDLTEATNPPTASSGDALFNGTSQLLTAAHNADTFLSLGAGTVVVLGEVLSTVSDAGAGLAILNPALVMLGGAPYFGMTVSNDGLRGLVNNGAYHEPAAIPISAGLHMFMLRWDGTNTEQSIDGGTPTSTVANGPSDLAWPLRVGVNYSGGAYANFKAREIFTIKAALDDVTLAAVAAFYGV